jgi:AraC family transcriptional regulator, positive regulator of tynA and feaB
MNPQLRLVPREIAIRAPFAEAGAKGAPRALHPPHLELSFACRDDWQAGLGRLLLPLECSVADPQSFQCSAVVGRLRDRTVAELRMDASRLTRRQAHIVAGDAALVQVLWLLSGRCRVQQGPHDPTLEAGSWTILDPGREYTLGLDKGSRVLTLLVPRAACPAWLRALPALGGAALRGGGPAHIALASLLAMLREVEPLDAESDAALHESVIALIGRALSTELQERGIDGQRSRGADLRRVLAYISEHLHDPLLNVATLARVFGISRRNVYYIFLPTRITPHSWIQNARLDRACALLEKSTAGGVAVATIARECGFSDPAHFSRAFRARHNLAPTAWRQRLR